MKMRRLPALLLPGATLLAVSTCTACAPDVREGARAEAGGIAVDRAVAWGLPAASELTVGMRLRTTGAVEDTLTGVSSPAGQAMLHDVREGRMVMVTALVVTPGAPTVLGTGGPHLMLEGVDAATWDSASVQVALHFRLAGKVLLRVPIVTYTEAVRGLRR